MTSLPVNMELIGGQRAFIMYNRSLFEANDDLHYRHFLRDLEKTGRLAKYFLPDSNYALCKLKSKRFIFYCKRVSCSKSTVGLTTVNKGRPLPTSSTQGVPNYGHNLSSFILSLFLSFNGVTLMRISDTCMTSTA